MKQPKTNKQIVCSYKMVLLKKLANLFKDFDKRLTLIDNILKMLLNY